MRPLDPAELFVLAASSGPRTVVLDGFLGAARARGAEKAVKDDGARPRRGGQHEELRRVERPHIKRTRRSGRPVRSEAVLKQKVTNRKVVLFLSWLAGESG